MAGQQGSAKAKQQRDKQRSAHLKEIGEERESGRCCICYGIVKLDRPESNIQGRMEAHMAGHARGNI